VKELTVVAMIQAHAVVAAKICTATFQRSQPRLHDTGKLQRLTGDLPFTFQKVADNTQREKLEGAARRTLRRYVSIAAGSRVVDLCSYRHG
jgi:hypothetical protein